MDKAKLLKRLKMAFLGELDERLRDLNRDLLALEAAELPEESAELVGSLFRSAHSLKGAARAVGEAQIERSCHQLEEKMSTARERQATFNTSEIQTLFALVDSIDTHAALFRQQVSAPEAAAPSARPNSEPPLESPPLEDPDPDEFRPPAVGMVVEGLPQTLGALSESQGLRPIPRPDEPAKAQATSRTLRVAADKLDELLTESGELVVRSHEFEMRLADLETLYDNMLRLAGQDSIRHAHGGAARSTEGIERLQKGLREVQVGFEQLVNSVHSSVRAVNRAAKTVDHGVRQLRMLPFSEACHSLRRIVRDLTAETDKDVEFVVTGDTVELDRVVLDAVGDALRHLVRNALDHGIESRNERIDAKKSPRARLMVGARLRDTQVEIEVSDDGRGLDLTSIRRQAAAVGLEHLEESELAGLIFSPGFTTKAEVTEISGRGVGLDAVRSTMETLHGRVSVSSKHGEGTTFTLVVPLTLTMLRALIVTAGGQHFAITSTNVDRMVRIKGEDVWTIQGRDVVDLGRPVPVMSLARLLELPHPAAMDKNEMRPAVVVSAAAREIAVVVDELVAEQQIVVKQLGPRLGGLRNVSGGTVLAAGEIAFIVNVAQLIRSALDTPDTAPQLVSQHGAARQLRLLVVDDSVTTRSLIVSILATAGYHVTAAVDGQDAWERIRRGQFDLVVSDVEMPKMSGFELTEHIRASGRDSLPIILVTTLDKPEDKLRGLEVGANAYIVKRGFDNAELLETILELT